MSRITGPTCGLWLILCVGAASAASERNDTAQQRLRTPPLAAQVKTGDSNVVPALGSRRVATLMKGIDSATESLRPHVFPSRVLVFVSLTMPDSSLKALLKQSKAQSVSLVIRGVLPQGFRATAFRILSLLEDGPSPPHQGGFVISPEWFDTFHIQEVPAFVAVRAGRCVGNAPCGEQDYDIVRGNVSLNNALDQLTRGDNPEVVSSLLRSVKP